MKNKEKRQALIEELLALLDEDKSNKITFDKSDIDYIINVLDESLEDD